MTIIWAWNQTKHIYAYMGRHWLESQGPRMYLPSVQTHFIRSFFVQTVMHSHTDLFSPVKRSEGNYCRDGQSANSAKKMISALYLLEMRSMVTMCSGVDTAYHDVFIHGRHSAFRWSVAAADCQIGISENEF